jgi:iron(III) transport system substrate-binding protein
MKKMMWLVLPLLLLISVFSLAGDFAMSAETNSLTLYTSQPDEDVQTLTKAFTKKYPEIKVNVFRSGTEEVVSKVMAENQSGRIQADVLLVADVVTFEILKRQNLLEAYQSPETKKIGAQFIDPNHMYTGTKIIASILAVNTRNAKKIPNSWTVLSDPASKNQGVMPSPLYSGAAAYTLGILVREKSFGWNFYQKLKSNNIAIVQGNGAAMKAVASGDKTYGMVVDYMVARAKQDGSPVELVYPKEGVTAVTEPVGIVKNTPNAASARKFIDFVLSVEGQQIAAGQNYTPVRKDVKAPEGLKNASQIKVLDSPVSDLFNTRDEEKKKFSDLFSI